MAFTSLWGVPRHCHFQTGHMPDAHAGRHSLIFHQMILTRHSEGTPLVSETAPHSTAPLAMPLCSRVCWRCTRRGISSGGRRPRREPGQSRCHRAEAGSPCKTPMGCAKEPEASVWVWSFKLACHTCHHSALFKCRETAGNQTHLYYIHTSERGVKIINGSEIDKSCETVE